MVEKYKDQMDRKSQTAQSRFRSRRISKFKTSNNSTVNTAMNNTLSPIRFQTSSTLKVTDFASKDLYKSPSANSTRKILHQRFREGVANYNFNTVGLMTPNENEYPENKQLRFDTVHMQNFIQNSTYSAQTSTMNDVRQLNRLAQKGYRIVSNKQKLNTQSIARIYMQGAGEHNRKLPLTDVRDSRVHKQVRIKQGAW